MLQALRRHLNPSTAIAFIALSFAVTGVSFAATGAGNGSGGGGANNKNTNSLPATTAKSKAKTGPRGPRGPAGPAGKNGANGTNGTNGAPGATGLAGPKGETGVAGATGPQGPQGEKGKEGKKGEEGAPGEPGEPGVIHGQEPLPKGATETGAWSLEVPAEYYGEAPPFAAVSFPVPLAAPIVNVGSVQHVFFLKAEESKPPECPGTAAKPEAAEGDFCAYTSETLNLKPHAIVKPDGPFGITGTGTSGALLWLLFESAGPERGWGYGTWAVTAP